MRISHLLAVLVLGITFSPVHAQSNQMQGGEKVGHWIYKDAQGRTCGEGHYKDGFRTGPWKFYLSEASKKQQTPDVFGSYSNSGMKHGEWTYINMQTDISVRVNFDNDLMQGECVYYDRDNSILARGLMEDGMRHGKWVFYDQNNSTGAYHQNGLKLNEKMTEGYYTNGFRIGTWEYDYYLDKNTRVKGNLTFRDGKNNGRLDFYKIEHHPSFGTTETLAGSGSYTNGRKTGRWIEFNYGTKGDFIETGNYNSAGKRDGLWKVRIGNQTHLSGNYNNGVPHGKFNHYYESGQLKSETYYNQGLEEGEFTHYYKSGQIEEQGTHVIINDEITRDTTFFSLKLPYEHNFLIIDEDNFEQMHYDYITWLHEPGYSIAPAELSRRFNVYRSYGFEANKRIANIEVLDKKTVREGEYLAFYEDGGLKLKGQHSPYTASLFNPNNHTIVVDYARQGEWKEYGEDSLLKNTYIYQDGKLKKMLDGNGYVVHTFKYEQNGLVDITDANGNHTQIDPINH